MGSNMMTGWLRRTAAAAALVGAATLGTVSAQAQSLTDAMILAYDSSPLLDQQRNLLRAQDEGVATAVAALRPSLRYQAQVSSGRNVGRVVRAQNGNAISRTTNNASASLIANWTLLDGGRRALQVAFRKEAVLAARWGLVDAEQTVLLNAVNAYLELALAVRTVDVRESNLRLITTQLDAARDRFEVGEVTRTDVAIAEARLAAAQSSLAAARGQVDIARETYRFVTGQLPGRSLSGLPPMPALPTSVEQAQALAVQIHPAIKQLQHTVVGRQILVQAQEAGRLPTVDFQVSAGVSDSSGQEDRSDSVSASITGSGPIYTGGRISSGIRAAVAELNADRNSLAQQARLVTQEVGQAWAMLQVAKAQVIASQEQIRSAQLAFEGFREEALLGARTTLDVLDAEQELLDARVARLQAETEAQGALYDVLDAIGLMTVDHLGLDVERYDPTEYYNAVRSAPATLRSSARGDRLDRVLQRQGRN